MSPRHAGWATRSPAWESQGQCPRAVGIMSRSFQIGQIESTWRGSESSSRGANRNSVAHECGIAWPSRTSSRLRSPWYSPDSPGKRISGSTDSEAESTQAPVEKVPSDRSQAGRNVHHHPEDGDRVDRQRGKDGRPVQVRPRRGGSACGPLHAEQDFRHSQWHVRHWDMPGRQFEVGPAPTCVVASNLRLRDAGDRGELTLGAAHIALRYRRQLRSVKPELLDVGRCRLQPRKRTAGRYLRTR